MKLNQYSVNALINTRANHKYLYQGNGFSLSQWIVARYKESKKEGESLQSFAHRIGMKLAEKK